MIDHLPYRRRAARLALIAAMALPAGAADAQSGSFPIPMPAPVPGVPRAAAERGITEQGRGIISLPAQRMLAEVRIFGSQPQTAPGAPAMTAASADADIARVVEAMRANGVPDAHESDQILGNVASGPIVVRGTVANPTYEKIAGIEKRTAAAIPSEILVRMRGIQVQGALEVDDCSAARDRARAAAYAQARARAEALAKVAGERLGGLIAADETVNDPGCGDEPSTGQPYFFNEQQERTDVDVSVFIRATFALLP